ncbi:MAG: polyprenyl synthetase family protein [Spirochaetaceae bacterium]
MKAFLTERRDAIARFLEAELGGVEADFERVSPWGRDVARRLLDFSTRGKMIRGGLVAMGAGLFGHEPDEDIVRVGAVAELIQSFLLIHDDIMDRDTARRGEDAVFYQYATIAREEGIDDWYHLGEALGTCVGDVAMLYAFDMLEGLSRPDEVSRRVRALFSREITWVGLAQMSDLYYGETTREVAETEIIDLYRFKTGRYTFSLPLSAGAVLAGQGDSTVAALGELGEKLGVIFQIKDDELGLFGDEELIGKPSGSDIAENKKTLFRQYLFARADDADRARLSRIFGSRAVNPEAVETVRELVTRYGVQADVDRLVNTWAEAARGDIARIAKDTGADVTRLGELLDYNLSRRL